VLKTTGRQARYDGNQSVNQKRCRIILRHATKTNGGIAWYRRRTYAGFFGRPTVCLACGPCVERAAYCEKYFPFDCCGPGNDVHPQLPRGRTTPAAGIANRYMRTDWWRVRNEKENVATFLTGSFPCCALWLKATRTTGEEDALPNTSLAAALFSSMCWRRREGEEMGRHLGDGGDMNRLCASLYLGDAAPRRGDEKAPLKPATLYAPAEV